VFAARLLCSDPECAAELSADAPTQRELETLVCECGCGLEVIAWPDWAGRDAAEVVELRFRARVLRRAA
jgi:hypothetical protein